MGRPDVEISYTDSANWNEREMRARFAWLRENAPVYWSEADHLWILTKHDDVEYVSKHQEIFTSAEGVRPLPLKIGLIDEAEPRHGELRALINKGFTPRMVKELEVIFRELTTRAIDAIADKGQCDFVESISVPLPLWLIASMLGIREEDWSRFHAWSDHMIAAEGNLGNPEIAARAGRAFAEYAAYATGVIEDRRREPREDLISILTGAKDAGKLVHFEEGYTTAAAATDIAALDGVENDELIKLCVILLVAGNETTRNGISGGMQLLIENPEQRDKLIEHPELLNDAVEEMVRLVSPVHSFCRTVLRDTELRGQRIERGQKVLMIYGSANRDREFYGEDADEFRIDRRAGHLGFGIGSHFCLGANLARMEMRVVFSELMRRLPDMEYAGNGPVLRNSSLVRTCAEMRVRFTPEGVSIPTIHPLAQAGQSDKGHRSIRP
jgi:cholest-4-en-3-one 26-monooxygenase